MSDESGPRAIAFFDVDNTLLRGASLYHLGVGAWRMRFISLADILAFGWNQTRFLAVGEDGVDMARLRMRAMDIITGHTRDELVGLSHDIFDSRLIHRLWPETVAVAHAHLKAGREVWLVTATAQEVADVIAERLDLTGALGTKLATVDGIFTGQLVDGICHGSRKAVVARGLAEDRGIDLALCWAYSDSHNDIPLLELVGNPVAVNPDTTLRRYALARGWPIMHMKIAQIKAAHASKKR
ncbi:MULTISPECIES: HAD family phosphatase [unclassified Cryobacterium]|uniref:HAD family hydrolase n=1 Tax=unclassified Cryobacterium TaxID=2649013 RepID=UPI00106D4516|nr:MULTISPECIES: HAD family hydrolase [unclassified Cryobacterium]TFC52529.1 HAD family hydrolase [Cryobacterium sp. TMB3-1-2]TFC66462.1 HAD family hydrolase [Cryobacterium sp. TMB3-15]TFC72635.1 HAD family hydrolase [Cryobacterium sp. TMB3-10]TFD40423.1 HAD family hydrolase [Cryobacterium sp. TMB3-12]